MSTITSRITPQAKRVLALLVKSRNVSYFALANRLDLPDASVRRSVGELIRAGYPVSRPAGLGGYVSYTEPDPTTTDIFTPDTVATA